MRMWCTQPPVTDQANTDISDDTAETDAHETEDNDDTTFNIHITVTDGTNAVEGASVTFGDVSRTTGSQGGANIYNITAGSYTLEVTADGFEDYTSTVVVDDDEDVSVTLTASVVPKD